MSSPTEVLCLYIVIHSYAQAHLFSIFCNKINQVEYIISYTKDILINHDFHNDEIASESGVRSLMKVCSYLGKTFYLIFVIGQGFIILQSRWIFVCWHQSMSSNNRIKEIH